MKQKGKRIALFIIELFVGLWAVIGGFGLVTGAIPFLQMPVEYLQGTPFRDYTIPGLLLLFIVGGCFLFAATMVLTRYEVGILASALAGLTVVVFEAVESPIIDRYPSVLSTSIPQQVLMALLGLVCIGIAAFIWWIEYRDHSILNRVFIHARSL